MNPALKQEIQELIEINILKLKLQKTKSLRPVKNNDEKLKELLRRPKKLNQHLTQYKQK